MTAVSAGADRLTALLEPADVRAVRGGAGAGDRRRAARHARRAAGRGLPGRRRRPAVTSPPTRCWSRSARPRPTGSVRALGGRDRGRRRRCCWPGSPLVCWLLVGRSLQPVSRLRTGAEEIAAAGSLGRAPAARAAGPGRGAPAGRDPQRHARPAGGRQRAPSGRSSPTRRTSCAARSRRSGPSSRWRGATPGPRPWDETADGVLADTDRLARLVDDLLLLARAERRPGRRRAVGRRAPVDGRRRRPAAEVAADALAGAGADRRRTSVAAACVVRPTRDAVTRVLVNLVDNAARHARSAVDRRRTVLPAGQVEVTVDDDGRGIPEADRERVFERFTRLDEARSRDRRRQRPGPGDRAQPGRGARAAGPARGRTRAAGDATGSGRPGPG